jgi:hypothetical protein
MTMNKEWKAELRGLLKQKRSILKDCKRANASLNDRWRKMDREIARERTRIGKAALKASARVDARIAVLEGRLAS